MNKIVVEVTEDNDYKVSIKQEGVMSSERLYICRGYDSAIDTAKTVRKELFPGLEIAYFNGEDYRTIIQAE